MILSIDPGITTGWSLVASRPGKIWWELIDFGDFKLTKDHNDKYEITEFSKFLTNAELEMAFDKVIVEDFIMRPGFREEKWTTLETSKLVGATIDRCREVWKMPCVVRQPSNKDKGQKLSGLKRSSNSDPSRHWKDSANHAVAYLHEQRYSNLRKYANP